ncbi:RNase adapter RapZ [Thermosipho ferrireducens]|uniref:RNase adapter RapZ n=1 Tax=Thermosipho ferrireducens TaxID=2571116 RepID=A0ABX7S4G6_9BACT|nr:RNase adapter RapZ [Thermosipho ferrireducens]QTA37342.1 RNase adapter RapZ [Thermosipho ferrireducens]
MKKLVILTGLSGAGKSTAMGLLEDLGFYCIDNFPPVLVDKLLPALSINIENLVLVMDARSGYIEKLVEVVNTVKRKYSNIVQVIFLMAKKEVLMNRFAHTRRNHPLLKEFHSLEKAVENEIERTSPLKEMADIIIDTSFLNPHELREKLKTFLEKFSQVFSVRFVSFGFKYGIPLDVDFIFDVRFFPNPFYINGLRDKSGKDKEVKEFMYMTEGVKEYLRMMGELVKFAVQKYENEGRMEINVGIGCTGGQHRSVFFAEELGEIFSEKFNVTVEHRDVK